MISTTAIAAVEACFIKPPSQREIDALVHVRRHYREQLCPGPGGGGSLPLKVNCLARIVTPPASMMASGLNCVSSLSSTSLSQRLSRISQRLSYRTGQMGWM